VAITETPLTGNAQAGTQAVFTTASITPTANRLILAVITARHNASSPGQPSLSGNGLTWVVVEDRLDAAARQRITVFRAMGPAPSTGAVTITYPASVRGCAWSISEYDGVDTSGSNGSGAIVQSAQAEATGTSLTVTLAAFADAANATFGGFYPVSTVDESPGAGFTEIHDFQAANGFGAYHVHTEWRNDNDTSVDQSSTNSVVRLGVAIEIKAVPTGTAHSRTITDALGIGDSISRVMVASRTITDPLGMLDSVTRVVAASRSLTDPLGLTDLRMAMGVYRRSATDALGLVDQASRVHAAVRQLTDPLGLTDDVTTELIVLISRVITDPVGLADNVARVATMARQLTDPVGLLDAMATAVIYRRALTDPVGLLDTVTRALAAGRTITDPLGLLDAVVVVAAGAGGPGGAELVTRSGAAAVASRSAAAAIAVSGGYALPDDA
jgi:hypothetical protein